jgi:hypothetical protein
MEQTGADFTDTFHSLSMIPLPALKDTIETDGNATGPQDKETTDGGFLHHVLPSLPSPQHLAASIAPGVSVEVCVSCQR